MAFDRRGAVRFGVGFGEIIVGARRNGSGAGGGATSNGSAADAVCGINKIKPKATASSAHIWLRRKASQRGDSSRLFAGRGALVPDLRIADVRGNADTILPHCA